MIDGPNCQQVGMLTVREVAFSRNADLRGKGLKSRFRESVRKARKSVGLLKRRSFARAMFVHRVAAATEHLPIIRICEPNTLIDAGANKGQFSLAFRALRPDAQIVAFEPLPQAADRFEALFAEDSLTQLQRVALAETEGVAEFHVADKADSSSLLKPGEAQARAFGVRHANTVQAPVKRLDTCVDLSTLPHPILLKVDVQGGEMGVFEGCEQLGLVDFIDAELSFVELYTGQPLFDEVNAYLSGRGFKIIGVFNQVSTDEFGPTQADVLFGRSQVR